MNRDSLLGLYDRFTRLVEKLPGGLQKPILRELTPIRELFLEQRPARIVLLGSPGKTAPEFLDFLCQSQVETGESTNNWRQYRIPGRGEVLLLDARAETPRPLVESALGSFAPDAAILLMEPGTDRKTLDSVAERAALLGDKLPIVAVTFEEDARLVALLGSHPEFSRRQIQIVSGSTRDSLPEILCVSLSNPARLEFARMTGAKGAQAQIASSLLKSFSAMCGVIGLQPIPLADMPVLTTLQALMVGLIIHTSGKPASTKLVAEFLGAIGLNIGAGILFRESARAIIKIVPLWGNAVSGFVAGAGTYAIGRAAIAYFIEETPLNETKKLFHKLLPGWDAFKRRRLPALSHCDDTSGKTAR